MLNDEKPLRVNTFLSKDGFVSLMRIKIVLLIKYFLLKEFVFMGLVLLLLLEQTRACSHMIYGENMFVNSKILENIFP